MHLRKLHIKNLKLIRDLELDFVGADGEPRMWTVVIAENGMCKTALLQAIALVASGQDRANQLANIDSLPDRRRSPPEPVEITATFGFSQQYHLAREYPGIEPANAAQPPLLRAQLLLQPGWRAFRSGSFYEGQPANLTIGPLFGSPFDPLAEVRARDLAHWFCAAYGVSRSLPPPSLSTEAGDLLVTRMQSLFGKGPILGTNFADFFMPDDARAFASVLRDVLRASQELLPRITGLSLYGRGGVDSASRLVESHRFDYQAAPNQRPLRLPATWLSHGYQSTIAWVADVVGHIMWEAERKDVRADEMEGIVLVDELDAHLHPRWQLTLVHALKSVFPRLQFIVTTHSPLLLGGLAEDEIVRLTQDGDGNIVAGTPSGTPAIMTGSELFDTYFGVTRPAYAAKLQRYALLATDPERTDAEDAEVHTLLAELTRVGIDPELQPVRRRARS